MTAPGQAARPASAGTLEEALAAVGRQDFGPARDALVEVWRTRRSPAIAELVDTLDPRAPDALTAQLAALVTPRVTSSLANLRTLHDVDDPRLASYALDALVKLPFTADTAEGFLLMLVEVIERHGDPRLGARRSAIDEAITTRINRLAIRTRLLRRIAKVAAELPEVTPPTAREAASERALVKAIEPLRASARSAESLLADIYANPEDDGPRLVYADLLLEQGDPRGELIALQIERAKQVPVAPPTAREQELLKRHGKLWLGALAPVLSWGKGYSKTEFRRGFVATADIILSVGKKLRPIQADPAWATVEVLDGLYADEARLLETAPLRALRALQLDATHTARLANRAEPLVGVRSITLDAPADAALLRRAFPNLVTVRAYRPTHSLAAIFEFAACGTDHVVLQHYHVDDPALRAARTVFEAFVQTVVGTFAPVARLTLGPPFSKFPGPAPVELRRDAAGNYERVDPRG